MSFEVLSPHFDSAGSYTDTFLINEADSNFPAFTVSNGLLPCLKECAIGAYDDPFKSAYLKSDVWLTVHLYSVWIRKTN